jgi:hypothetical protein
MAMTKVSKKAKVLEKSLRFVLPVSRLKMLIADSPDMLKLAGVSPQQRHTLASNVRQHMHPASLPPDVCLAQRCQLNAFCLCHDGYACPQRTGDACLQVAASIMPEEHRDGCCLHCAALHRSALTTIQPAVFCSPTASFSSSNSDGGQERASLQWLSRVRPITAQKYPGIASSTSVKNQHQRMSNSEPVFISPDCRLTSPRARMG